ncbi:hypothetical protein SHIRM173S_12052 [Streptomyces hirsutus]
MNEAMRSGRSDALCDVLHDDTNGGASDATALSAPGRR